MDKMIVDPELFITCRLCLIQKGLYQIVPSVQKQIKFCFDIDVEPFDGLPQLICKDCEEILTNFNEIKANYKKKQHTLRSGLPGCSSALDKVKSTILQEQDEVTSTETSEDKFEQELNSLKIVLKKKQNTSIDGKNDTTKQRDSCASSYSVMKKSKPKKHSQHSENWRDNYEKLFSCQFCLSCFKDKKSIYKHLKTHEALLSQYKLKHCSIPVVKEDGKKNITGLPNTVVLHHDKIIQHFKPSFSVVFKRKTESVTNIEKLVLSDSSDDNYTIQRKAKRLRLLSKSSNETVVLDDSIKNDKLLEHDNESEKKVKKATNECVDIGDSSESDSVKKDIKLPDIKAINDSISKIISNTVASCLYKYVNRCNSSENYKESLLMQKALSIGVRIMDSKPFSCPELLRFLGFRHLNVEWVPRTSTKKFNSVLVKIKLKESVVPNSNIGWNTLSTITKATDVIPLHDLLDKIHGYDSNFSTYRNEPSDNAIVDPALLTSNEAVVNVQSQNDSCSQLMRVLLNKSPVANPKQLPKKSNSQNLKRSLMTSGNSSKSSRQATSVSMPVITNTVSLARTPGPTGPTAGDARVESTDLSEESSTNNRTNIDGIQPQYPRIKVKPVSQLMAATSSDITSTSIPNWNTPVPTCENPFIDDIDQTNSGKENVVYDNEFVIMHTVELPNMKTSSPFLYFQKLLQIHNITLLNSTDPIQPNFSCLIKFKSIFNQEKHQSVTLGMGLFSDSHNFALKLKDLTTGIDIVSLSPRWQWEVLQLYKGQEIVSRLLDNARNISQKMYDATYSFIGLLRCIVFSQCT